MAEVFAGTAQGSHGFQKPVAIKRLLPELANDHVFVERLIGEAKLLISLQHGNVVSVLDLARDGDDVFLVMEYVDGPSLRQLLKARGNRHLPLGIASYVVQSAAAGLEFAHARPGGAIIHADISPSNLLLTTSGEVRVADFGIARREGGGNGVVEGKWAYMAPEQARGESLTPRSDVFALGVVLYELITGQHPLGKQVTADERDSGPIRITPPRMVNPAVPVGLDAICMKALAERASDRYARMQQMIDAIVDERFANAWREGANDLAGVIAEIRPGVGPANAGPRTQITDRPVTIVTRSLISESAAKRRSQPRLESASESQSAPAFVSAATDTDSVEETRLVELPPVRGSIVALPSSGARTAIVEVQSLLRPSVPTLAPPAMAMPAMPGPDAATLEAYRLASSMVPSPELASVHGGHTFTGSAAIDVRDARSMKWTFAVLGVAALVGVIAAVAITLAPGERRVEAKPAPAPVAFERAPAPAPAPSPAPAPVVQPTVTAIAQPDPAPVAAPPVAQPIAADPTPVSPKKPHDKVAARPAPKAADSVLRVETYNGIWAWAYVGSQRLDVPGAKFKLAPGTYSVRLRNTTLHVNRTCSVTLGAHEVKTIKVDMEEGGCE